jgi:hypothetical protein
VRLNLPLLLAFTFSGLHLIFALSDLIPSGTSGESAALGFLLYDYPLHGLVGHFDWGTPFRFDSGRHYVVFFSIVGTLMHGAFGFLLGFLLVSLVRAFRSKRR